MHSRQLRLALILDPKFLYLRGFRVGNSLNVPSLIRHVGGIFSDPCSPQVFDILEFAHKHRATELRRDDNKNFCSSQLSFLEVFLFAGLGFKCLAVCYRRNGFYNLCKISKCCSFMSSSRRLLQKNTAFMILLSFLLLYTSEPG